jgi:hypothetical protein
VDREELGVEIPGFPGRDGWRAGFTTRRVGEDLGPLRRAYGWDDRPLFRLRQEHGTKVWTVEGPGEAGGFPRAGDGLATSAEGVILAVASADCVPLILFDSRAGAGAVLHAGWRGTCAGIAREGIRVLGERFGCHPADLRAVIGPAIGACCYRVGPEVMEAFALSGHSLPAIRSGDHGSSLDLRKANRLLLAGSGVPESSIHDVDLCTRCRGDLFPSYRRDGAGAGRFLAYLAPPAAP